MWGQRDDASLSISAQVKGIDFHTNMVDQGVCLYLDHES